MLSAIYSYENVIHNLPLPVPVNLDTSPKIAIFTGKYAINTSESSKKYKNTASSTTSQKPSQCEISKYNPAI